MGRRGSVQPDDMPDNFYITLNDGTKMPRLGLGTWKSPPEQTKQAIITAVRRGSRQEGGSFHPGQALEWEPPDRARQARHHEDLGGSPAGLHRLLRDPLAPGSAQHRQEPDTET